MKTFITLIVSAAAACSAVSAATPADALRDRLDKMQNSGKIAFGQHDATVYGRYWAWDDNRCDVKEVTGDYPAICNWDLGWLEIDSPINLDSVPFERIRREVRLHDARGGINTVSWHPQNPFTLGNAWDKAPERTPVAEMVTPGTELNNTLTKWIEKTADFIGSLKDAQGNRIPVVFRPWHEHTGTWFWWGQHTSTPEQYKQLWKMTREVFDRKGIDNVVWAYSPDKVTTEEAYFERYPGDDLIDILGADIYAFNGEEGIDTFLGYINTELPIAVREAKKRGKIAALTECGLEGITVPYWYDKVLLPAISQYPLAYITVWRNSPTKPNHWYVPYKGHPAEESFRNFYKSDKTAFLKDLK